jgi:hypothetical protein
VYDAIWKGIFTLMSNMYSYNVEDVIKAFYSTGMLVTALVFFSRWSLPLWTLRSVFLFVSPYQGHQDTIASSSWPLDGVGHFEARFLYDSHAGSYQFVRFSLPGRQQTGAA